MYLGLLEKVEAQPKVARIRHRLGGEPLEPTLCSPHGDRAHE